MKAYDRVVAALESRGSRHRGFDWQCPAHEDGDPSLSVRAAKDRALLHCQAGCSTEDVVGSLGLSMADLFDDTGKLDARTESAAYDYTDEAGTLLFQAVRFWPKEFRQRRPDGQGGWEWNLEGVRRVLYRLPAVVEAVRSGQTIFLVEGEKDVHAIERAGAVATCNPMGAGKWRPEYAEALIGAHLVVVADKDKAGYDHARTVAASLEGKAATVGLVQAREGKDAADHLAAGFKLEDFDPLPEETVVEFEPGSLLDSVRELLVEYVAFPSDAAADAVTLWAQHAHAVESFESTPRLALLSPEKQTGKTRTLEVLDQLVPVPMHAVNCTSAAMFRAVAAKRPTLLFDEADTYFGVRMRTEHEELRGLVNAGHRKGAVAYRVVGEGGGMQVREFPAFAAVAIAGIGELPDTILDRAVVIRMRRRSPDEHIEAFRLRKVKPRAATLRDVMAVWARSHAEELAQAEPEMPPGITDRPADVWEALLAVADAAGGSWPKRARAAAVALESARAEATPSRGTQLLADIRTVFDVENVDRLSSEDLCRLLAAMEEAPWGDLRGRPIDARGLATRLRPYGPRPHNVRFGEAVVRGYLVEDFADAWKRYLPRETTTTATESPSATGTMPLTSTVTDVAHVAEVGQEMSSVADARALQGNGQRASGRLEIAPDFEILPDGPCPECGGLTGHAFDCQHAEEPLDA